MARAIGTEVVLNQKLHLNQISDTDVSLNNNQNKYPRQMVNNIHFFKANVEQEWKTDWQPSMSKCLIIKKIQLKYGTEHNEP